MKAETNASAGQHGSGQQVVLHEEALHVSTAQVPVERIVLRRHITTEVRQVEVTVRREELHVERHPVDASVSVASGGTHLPIVIVLSEEVPVVQVRTRPYERVTVRVDDLTQGHRVEQTVSRERADVRTEPPTTPA